MPGSTRCRWACTARRGPTSAASAARPASGVWFLPIYLGPTLAMLLAALVLRKMIRIARHQRITSIADFIASRHGKSPLLAGAGDADRGGRHRAVHRAAAEGRGQRLRGADRAAARATAPGGATARCTSRWRWPASRSCSAPGTSTPPSATRAWSRRSRSSRWSSCWPSWRSARSSPGACSRARRPVRARAGACPRCAGCWPRSRAPRSPTTSGSR